MKTNIFAFITLIFLISICYAQMPIMSFTTEPNSTLLSASMNYRWIEIVVDPNGGSPRTNFTGVIFNRNSTGNKTVI
jgi:hypothetical protein